MTDVDVAGDTAETENKATLYDSIVEITGMQFSPTEYDSVEEYKSLLVREFNKLFPPGPNDEDSEGDIAFRALPGDVQEWVNAAVDVVHSNRGAKRKKKLPTLEGLDVEEDEKKGEPKKRGRKPSKEKAEKSPVEKKERGPNRYLRAMRVLHKHPDASPEELAEKADIAVRAGGYCIEAFRAAQVSFEEAGYVKR